MHLHRTYFAINRCSKAPHAAVVRGECRPHRGTPQWRAVGTDETSDWPRWTRRTAQMAHCSVSEVGAKQGKAKLGPFEGSSLSRPIGCLQVAFLKQCNAAARTRLRDQQTAYSNLLGKIRKRDGVLTVLKRGYASCVHRSAAAGTCAGAGPGGGGGGIDDERQFTEGRLGGCPGPRKETDGGRPPLHQPQPQKTEQGQRTTHRPQGRVSSDHPTGGGRVAPAML